MPRYTPLRSSTAPSGIHSGPCFGELPTPPARAPHLRTAPRHAAPSRNLLPASPGNRLISPSALHRGLSSLRIMLCAMLLSLLLPGCLGRRTTSSLEAPARPESAADTLLPATARSFDLEGPFTRNDTLFLRDWQQVDTTDGMIYYGRVFVEKTTPESVRSYLSQQWHPDYWKENLALLKKRHPEPFPIHNLHDCPTAWLPVTSFRGTLYIDTAFEGPVWLSDSLLVQLSQEGPWPIPLQSVERPDKLHYRLLTADNQLDIHTIDTLRQIAVFTYHNPDNSTYRSLYAPLETAQKLDFIVWNCSEIPDYHDVSWDQIDYDALILKAQDPDNTYNEK